MFKKMFTFLHDFSRGGVPPPGKWKSHDFERNQSLGLRQLKWPQKISMASPNEKSVGLNPAEFVKII